MTTKSNNFAKGLAPTIIALIVFEIGTTILPDLVRWVSIAIEGDSENKDAFRVAIGVLSLISIGSAAYSAKAQGESYKTTVVAVLITIAFAAHGLVLSSQDANEEPVYSEVQSALYIVFVFLVGYLLLILGGRTGDASALAFRLNNTVVGAFVGFIVGLVYTLVIKYSWPEMINPTVRYIVQPEATLCLATVWGSLVLPSSQHKDLGRTVWVYLFVAAALGFGFGVFAYTPDWTVNGEGAVFHCSVLSALTWLLTFPSVLASVAVTTVIQQKQNTSYKLIIGLVVNYLLVAVLIIFLIPENLPVRSTEFLPPIKDLLYLGVTVIPILAMVSVLITRKLNNWKQTN